jgi:RNA-directed DNA polymerase
VRYADDFVVLHKDREVIHKCQQFTQDWLKQMGLELKPEKTRVVHTLATGEHDPGFQFLGFNIRQFTVGKNRSGTDSRGNILGFKTRITPSKQDSAVI